MENRHTIVAGGPDDATAASNGPVTLPPSITASKSYRCKDNKVIYINWMSDGKSATIRTEQPSFGDGPRKRQWR